MNNTLPENRGSKQLVLVVEDEPKLSRVVSNYLERDGYLSQIAGDCALASQCIYSLRPELIILDIMLPDGSGLDILKKLRTSSDVPVILLTAKSEEVDKIMGLEFGADDYVSKPFSVRELMARVKTNLRRVSHTVVDKRVRVGGLELREDIETVLEPGMVVSMEPMFTIPEDIAGAGGYREHDILVVGEDGAANITKFPFVKDHNIIKS